MDSEDATQAVHDSYVEPRCQALAGECEWPDDGEWPLDLFIELTDPTRIVVVQRPFGTELGDADEDSLMSMSITEDRNIDSIISSMSMLLLEVSRIVIVATEDQLSHWVHAFHKLAQETNLDKGSIVRSVVAISKDLVASALREYNPEAPVHAFVEGECVEMIATEMSNAVDEGKPGYMLYAMLLPGYQLVDMPFEDMPAATSPQPGKDFVCVEVRTIDEVCMPVPTGS